MSGPAARPAAPAGPVTEQTAPLTVQNAGLSPAPLAAQNAGPSPAALAAPQTAESSAARPMIEMRGIVKRYYEGKPNELEILHGIDLTVYPGDFVAIVGESGSGKSTLMNIIGALDRPTLGSYLLDGLDVLRQKDARMSEVRNRKIGFVFQNFNLIGCTSAQKNVELPMLYAGLSPRKRAARAAQLLKMVGMADRARHQPNELSGGQKQRVAIARAMANDPAILLADEPTGALDSATSRTVMDIFHRLNRQAGKTVVLITHSQKLAEECPRILTLLDGRIVDERRGREVRGDA